MKIKIAYILLIIFVSVMCGCQSTPSKEIIVNGGNGELEETIMSETVESKQYLLTDTIEDSSEATGKIEKAEIQTEHWEDTYALQKLKCEINAEIMVPENGICPVFKVKKRDFNEDIVKKIVEYFTIGATGVRETSPTKEELEQKLIQTKRGYYVLDDNGGRWETYEDIEQRIEELEDQIKSAKPEVFSPVTDSSYAFPINNTFAMPNKKRVYVRATQQRIDVFPEKAGCVQPESWIIDGDAFPGEPVGTTLKNVKINKDEACNLVNSFLTQLNIQGLGISKMEKARIIIDYTYETVSEGWKITLSRNDGNSIPVYINSSEVYGLLTYQPENYVERWRQEKMVLYVDETGVKSIEWKNPIEVVEQLNENVPVKDFEEIKKMILKYIKFAFTYNYGDSDITEQQIKLTKVILTNVLIPMKDQPEYHMLVPAWIVYYEQEDGLGVYTSILAVNAIDGSSIDLNFDGPDADSH